MEDMRSNKGNSEISDTSRSNTLRNKMTLDSQPLDDIEEVMENAISPKAKEARLKDQKRQKFAKKIKNYHSPSLEELVYNFPRRKLALP